MRRRKRRRFSFYLSVPEGLVARSGFIAMTGSLLEPGLPRLSVPSADVGPANIADKSASKFDAALDSVIVRSFSLLLSSSLFSLLSSSSSSSSSSLSSARSVSLLSLFLSLFSLLFLFLFAFQLPAFEASCVREYEMRSMKCLFLQKEIKT